MVAKFPQLSNAIMYYIMAEKFPREIYGICTQTTAADPCVVPGRIYPPLRCWWEKVGGNSM